VLLFLWRDRRQLNREGIAEARCRRLLADLQFCHNNPWVIIGETELGRGDRAFDYWRKIAPAYREEISEVHRLEPYVYVQTIAGQEAPKHGDAKNSWLTGTAAWNFVAITQYILGVRPEFDGLRVEPCLPESMTDLSITRRCRGWSIGSR